MKSSPGSDPHPKTLLHRNQNVIVTMETKSAEETHPYFFKPDQNINRRLCTRTVPMQVLSLGMSRTGTACK